MKNIISFVMLMLVLALPIAFAEDTANETEAVSAEVTETIEAEVIADTTAEAVETETTTDEATPVLILAPAETTEEVVVEGVADYGVMEQAWDRLRLAFTFQQEKRAELISKITAKREAHYQFLVAKGKTNQATKFQEGTTKLQATLQKSIDKKAAKVETKAQNKLNAADNISGVEEQARERVKSKVAEKVEANIGSDEVGVEEETETEVESEAPRRGQ